MQFQVQFHILRASTGQVVKAYISEMHVTCRMQFIVNQVYIACIWLAFTNIASARESFGEKQTVAVGGTLGQCLN